VKREAEKVEHTTHRQAAAPSLAQTRTTWPRSRRALEDAGVIFIDRGKGGGPEVRLKA
jgi:hypothetical protein